ncbi:MAG: hybrid sensor histidine kinase/response regulator [Pseudomonadales bacterium]|nr:hybrid sensor histidine kinase/response regulator [Pseudomonadales bacterium]
MNEIGIKARLLLMTLIPAGILATAVGAYFSWQHLGDLQQQLLERGQLTAEHLQRPATEALLAGQPERLRSALASTLNYQDVRAVALYDADHHPLEHSGPQMFIADQPVPETPLAAGTGLQIRSGERSTRFVLPLQASPELLSDSTRTDLEPDALIGWLEVELSHGNTQLRTYQTLLSTLVLVLLGLLITSLMVSTMGRRILEPIADINQAIARISRGQLDVRLPKQGARELDDLVEGINTMAQALQSAQGELQQNVEQATEDLRQTLETIEVQNIELDMARKAAQEASRIKSEFLANMSHELRTPLNGIIGFSNLLQRTEMTTRQSEYLDTISKSAGNLLAIINEILDFSKIEAGKLTLESMPFNLRDQIEEALTILAPAAHQKQIELVSLIYSDVPLGLKGDALRLKQILSNLLSNAIKFTHVGSVCLRVMLEEENDSEATLRISVSDTGVGLSEAQQKSLFRAFSQVDNSLTRQTGGTGLGLVITKRLVEEMQGDIGLNSRPGEGSEFWLTITLNKSSQASDDLPVRPFSGIEVAVYEPLDLTRQALLHSLEGLGLQARLYASLSELDSDLNTANGQTIQLALISSGNNDSEWTERVQAAQRWAAAGQCQSILLVDTVAQPDLLDQLPPAHCAVLSRPLCLRKLYRTLTRLLSPRAGVAAESSTPLLSERRSNPDSVSILCVDDNPANLKLVETFLQEMGPRVRTATSGENALDILDEQRFDLIFMDVQMPGMDGRQTTEELRIREEISQQSATPVVALTAHALADERRKLLKCGMNDYLSKPINPEQLRDSILKWTGHDLSPGAAPKLEERPEQPADSEPRILDHDEGLRLAAGKADLAQEMLDMLMQSLPGDREQIEQSYRAGNTDALLETVHRLHGATRYCGVPELRRRCLQAETRLKEKAPCGEEIERLLEAVDRLQGSLSVL